MKNFEKFEKIIKIKFKDPKLLKQAFIHRSYLNENPSKEIGHNERLEFLGDAVLELATTEYLYKKYPDKTEGDMTGFRASLVNAVMLSEVANEIGMSDFLLLSKGEAKDEGKARQFIMANTFEALVGAIYLDSGFKKASVFLNAALFPKLEKIIEEKLWIDAKSLFQEKAQDALGITPTYRLIREWGPDHIKTFVVGVYLDNEMIAEGSGFSKQEAEQHAARGGLKAKHWVD
ncbi:MAG: ribonuclease III [Candidatus Paceibacterota bacterium]